MANYSIYNDIYTYLSAQSSLTSLCSLIAWDGLPDTTIESTRILYKMIDDIRVHDSYLRNQRWRFWICIPDSTTTPKVKCLAIANKMLDLLHEQKGAISANQNVLNIECVSNQDPFYDEPTSSWIIIQDYIFKMKKLS